MLKKLAIISLILTALFASENKNTAEARISVGINVFFDALSPYGNWVSVPTYGNVWYPTDVQPDWRPFTDGHWVWSDYGWTWASYEPWGWASYHYGRWQFLDYYGWVWIPGTNWAPAWVTWYNSPGYIGWAPLAPDNDFFYERGLRFNRYEYHDYYTPPSHCVFVPSDKFLHHNVHSFAVPKSHNVRIFKNSTHINNIKIVDNKVINRGPDVGFVERVSKRSVKKVNLVERDIDTRRLAKSGRNVNKLQGSDYHVYRPDIVIKDNESTSSNRSPKKRELQIEDRDQSFPDQDGSEKVNTRKYYEPRKELSTNKLRTRNKKEPGYFNDKTVIKNEDEFQKRDNFVNTSDKKYQLNRGNKKRNFHDIQKSHGSQYKDTNLKKGYKFDKKAGNQQYRAFESNIDNVKKINDSDKRAYNRMTPRYNEGKTNTRGEKIRTKDSKRESRMEKRELNPRSTQKFRGRSKTLVSVRQECLTYRCNYFAAGYMR